MPALRTEVTEIVTGLAMLGHTNLDRAIGLRPDAMRNVGPEEWERLTRARAAGELAEEFTSSWENGLAFLRADRGLRRRPPQRVEWKGNQRPPGYDQLPADLRVDHVYLISCKYLSRILINAAPAHLFARALVDRPAGRPEDWYVQVAPDEYQSFYAEVRRRVNAPLLPDLARDLTPEHRGALKAEIKGAWPSELVDHYREFAAAVSEASASRWRSRLPRPADREEMLWRILRLQSSPYFVLGTSKGSSPLRVQVVTPWDWRQAYELIDFEIVARVVGQPRVDWRALIKDRERGLERVTEGHVEVRWSHGRFAQMPEAKVYLDTPHHDVCGYEVF